MLRGITISIQDKVLQQLEATQGNYVKVGSKFGLTTQQVKHIDIVRNKKFNYTTEGRGRIEMQKYIVAIKPISHLWDNNNQEIAAARSDFEAGKTILTTGRDGLNSILYSIPKKIPTESNTYFTLLTGLELENDTE